MNLHNETKLILLKKFYKQGKSGNIIKASSKTL